MADGHGFATTILITQKILKTILSCLVVPDEI